jgi:hypothetical protein
MEAKAGIMMRFAGLLAMALVVTGCGHPLIPTAGPVNTESAAALGETDLPVLGDSEPVLGVDLYAPRNYTAAQVQAYGERMLAYVKNVLKADVVGIVWNFYAADLYSDAIGATGATLSASNVGILTKIAIQDHLLVEYRPLILVPSAPNHWEGLINPYPPAKWFNNYYHAELPYLRIAQQLGVREFVAASEMQDLNNSPLWPSFFAAVSHIYHGVISYTSWDGNYFGAAPGTSFQVARPDLLPAKYLGVDMYWHMNLPAAATATEVTAAWEALFSTVSPAVLRRTAIDETGIQARAGAYSRPEDLNVPGLTSEQVQVSWFTAACDTVRRYHMRGVFFFKVDLADNPEHPAKSLSTFEGREGAAAISECAQTLH